MRKFGSWNIAGQSLPKVDLVASSFDLLCIQEMPRGPPGWDDHATDNFVWFSHQGKEQWRGVGIGVAREIFDSITDKTFCERGAAWVVRLKNHKRFILASLHCPTGAREIFDSITDKTFCERGAAWVVRLKNHKRFILASLHCPTGVSVTTYQRDVTEFKQALRRWHVDLPVLCGVDVNEVVGWNTEDSADASIRAGAKIDKTLEVMANLNMRPVAPQMCDRLRPTHYPRDENRAGRHIDAIFSRRVGVTPVVLRPELRVEINTDHALLEMYVEIQKTRPARWNTWDDGVEEGGRDDEWSEPQPEPAVDPYHQWNDQANMQNLGMGQWAPTWTGDNGGMVRPVHTVTSNPNVQRGMTDVLSVDGVNIAMTVLENLVVKTTADSGVLGKYHNVNANLVVKMTADSGVLGKYHNVNANLHVLLVLTANLEWKGRSEGMLVPTSSFTSLGGVVALLFYHETAGRQASTVMGYGLIVPALTWRSAGKEEGAGRPAAFRRATEESGGGLVVNQAMRDHFREILRRADRRDEPAQASPSPPQQQQYGGVGSDGVVHQVLTHTGGGTFSSPWWTAAEWRRWRARRARLAESTVEVGVDWSATGLPMVMDFVAELMGASPGMCSTPGTTTTTSSTCSSFSGTSPNSVPTARGTVTTSMAAVLTSLPSTSTSTFLENGQQGSGQEEEDVMLMQTGARTDAPDREENNRTEENSQVGENMSVGETAEEGGYGDGADGPEEPGEAYGLSADERDELVELGWDEGVVADLHEFLLYLSDVRSRAGAGAVAWALGQSAHSLILAESTLDLATDVLFRRVQGVAEERPEDFGVRGRLCVGFAGFQKALGGMHLRITQRLLQDEWMRTSDVGDPPLLGPAGGVLADNTQTAALALEASSSWEGTPEQDAAGHQPEHPGEDADDVEEDSHSLMQLTRDEENDLDNLAVDDEVRRCLRDLLRSLEEQENRDVGAEYRWGVQQVLEACVGAQRVMECVRNILRNRVVPSQAMRSWPCQRIPPFGPLRSRIGAWMAEYRWVVVQAFDRELGASLQELLGCPAASREPVGPATPARRGRATREPRVPPRGSRSRSPVVRSSSMVPGVGTGNVLSSTGVTSVVEGDTGMADEREDIGVRDRPAPDLPGDPGVRAGPGVGSDVPGLPVHAPPCGPIETVPVPPHGGSVGGDDDDGAVTASVARETGPGVAAGMGPGALDLPCLALPGEGVPALLEGPALPEGPGIRPRAPAAEGFDAGALPVPGDGVDVLRTSVLYGGLDASSTPGMGSMTGDGPEPEGSP
eukprot:s4950_g2.t1